MKREIKFRAWDKTKKCFLPDDCYSILNRTNFGAFGVMIKDFEDYKEGEYFYDSAQELMQCTGIKDKNGKEIYEGDIIKYKINDPKHPKNEESKEWIDLVIWGEYDDGEYLFHAQCWTVDGCPLSDMNSHTWGHPAYEFEVIGNIYENPELL